MRSSLWKMTYLIPSRALTAFVAVAVICTGTLAAAGPVERSGDFNVFWPQLRTALLDGDVDTLNKLSLSTSGIPFRYDTLDPTNSCERKALKAYLKIKLDAFYLRPGGKSWREVLTDISVLDLETHPDVDANAVGEYSLGLKVRFAKNNVDGAWDLVDMLDDRDRVFSFSQKAGGPSNC